MLTFLGLARSGEDWVHPSNAITRAVEAMLAGPVPTVATDDPVPGGEPAVEAAAVAEAAVPRKRKRLGRRWRRADAA
ncbi:MAG: hypothetical protein Kow0010_08900 [Dehalococcoidia bacterium]